MVVATSGKRTNGNKSLILSLICRITHLVKYENSYYIFFVFEKTHLAHFLHWMLFRKNFVAYFQKLNFAQLYMKKPLIPVVFPILFVSDVDLYITVVFAELWKWILLLHKNIFLLSRHEQNTKYFEKVNVSPWPLGVTGVHLSYILTLRICLCE